MLWRTHELSPFLSLSLSLSLHHTHSLPISLMPWKIGILCHTLSHWDAHILTHIYHISLSLCLSVVLKIQHTHMYTHRIAQHSNAFKDSLVQINTLSKALTHNLSLSFFLIHNHSRFFLPIYFLVFLFTLLAFSILNAWRFSLNLRPFELNCNVCFGAN